MAEKSGWLTMGPNGRYIKTIEEENETIINTTGTTENNDMIISNEQNQNFNVGEMTNPISPRSTKPTTFLRLEFSTNAENSKKFNLLKLTYDIIMVILSTHQSMRLKKIENDDELFPFVPFNNLESFNEYITTFSDNIGRSGNIATTLLFHVTHNDDISFNDILENKKLINLLMRNNAFIKEHKLAIGSVGPIGSIYMLSTESIHLPTFEKNYNDMLKNFIATSDDKIVQEIEIVPDKNVVEIKKRKITVNMETEDGPKNVSVNIMDIKCNRDIWYNLSRALNLVDIDKEKFGVFANNKIVHDQETFSGLVEQHRLKIDKLEYIQLYNITSTLLHTVYESNENEFKSIFTQLEECPFVKSVAMHDDRRKEMVTITTTKSETILCQEQVQKLLEKFVTSEFYVNTYGDDKTALDFLKPITSDEDSNDRMRTRIIKAVNLNKNNNQKFIPMRIEKSRKNRKPAPINLIELQFDNNSTNSPQTTSDETQLSSETYSHNQQKPTWANIAGFVGGRSGGRSPKSTNNSTNESYQSSISSLNSEISILRDNIKNLTKMIKEVETKHEQMENQHKKVIQQQQQELDQAKIEIGTYKKVADDANKQTTEAITILKDSIENQRKKDYRISKLVAEQAHLAAEQANHQQETRDSLKTIIDHLMGENYTSDEDSTSSNKRKRLNNIEPINLSNTMEVPVQTPGSINLTNDPTPTATIRHALEASTIQDELESKTPIRSHRAQDRINNIMTSINMDSRNEENTIVFHNAMMNDDEINTSSEGTENNIDENQMCSTPIIGSNEFDNYENTEENTTTTYPEDPTDLSGNRV